VHGELRRAGEYSDFGKVIFEIAVAALAVGVTFDISAGVGFQRQGDCRRYHHEHPDEIPPLESPADMRRAYAARLHRDSLALEPPVTITTDGPEATILVVVSDSCGTTHSPLPALMARRGVDDAVGELGFAKIVCTP